MTYLITEVMHSIGTINTAHTDLMSTIYANEPCDMKNVDQLKLCNQLVSLVLKMIKHFPTKLDKGFPIRICFCKLLMKTDLHRTHNTEVAE